ncbi:MAG TPA: glutamate synthase large subunit, partial [Cyanobacteria bacterium UBA8156]|nr:glutamate synthase large subunit [Cyanobacteria bacterium UBA8156]
MGRVSHQTHQLQPQGQSDWVCRPGPRWLVEERDSCGVGFVADRTGQARHDVLQMALQSLNCMEHRGGCGADGDSGDGAGVTTAIPWALLQQDFPNLDPAHSAVGMVFLPPDEARLDRCRQLVEQVIQEEGWQLVGWRRVPVNPAVLGPQARANQPQIEQVLVNGPWTAADLQRRAYILRRRFKLAVESHLPNEHEAFYVASLSSRTVVYKGMVRSAVLAEFYGDLRDPAYGTPFAVYHRRFSTNTMPRWPLAQPMRMLGHNGEINTLLGNVNWFRARERDLQHEVWGDRLGDFLPVLKPDESDSANLDHVFELLVETGWSPLEALAVLVPEAYENQPDLQDKPEITDFYEYFAGLQEPWDGPALLAFSDGEIVGALLDRNGLRPARYTLMRDGLVVVGSEAGTLPLDETQIVEKGRLGPGQAIAVDLGRGEILKNWDIKQRIAQGRPYGEWVRSQRRTLPAVSFGSEVVAETALLAQQIASGYTTEDVEMVVEDMARTGKEPVFCMGDDIPLAVLSQKPHLIYDYFKQRFAQVTNPPIDPLREGLVMSLAMYLGPRQNLLQPTEKGARQLKLASPVLNEGEWQALREQQDFPAAVLPLVFPVAAGPAALRGTLESLCEQAVNLVRAGTEILMLSDRDLDAERAIVPPLLAVGAIHHRLIREGLRMRASLVVETGQCWSTHHFACLIGYGASAVCPYVALATARRWWHSPKTQMQMEQGKLEPLTLEGIQQKYQKAIEGGLLKILSKMGISLLSSYQGAQIFEALGLSGEVIDLSFAGTVSRLGGMTLTDLAQEAIAFHRKAFPLTATKLENYGFVQARPSGEYHANSPEVAKALHKALEKLREIQQNPHDTPAERAAAIAQHYQEFEVYRQQVENRTPTSLRDLLHIQSDRPPLPIAEVEPATRIAQRFCTGAMSLGALSREAHEVLAIAMNRIGGKSNCGEGGEDEARYGILADVEDGRSALFPHLKGLRNGDTPSSHVKQVASGRFGVTPFYLATAKQMEIKVAQGAKPGEGGQLPGPKVSEYIAKLRYSKPGVPLISPPPHHDIYSIEDLAQLIYDLHQINPQGKVSVKLVAEIGIGTVAAGVAKANADVIQISGHDGGTGASPLSSIKHAGVSWELGLTEVHRVLMQNQLRDRVLLRVDGGFKTGRDVVLAALMGGEEYGFGTIAMIAEGCIMARVCHTNKCPVGVTSQLEQFRKRFPGTPDHVVDFMFFVAEEVRHLLAQMGYRSLEEVIGRGDLLAAKAGPLTKTQGLDLRCLTDLPDTRSDRTWLQHSATPHSNGPVLDDELLADGSLVRAIAEGHPYRKAVKIVSTDRSVGARIAGRIAQQYGNAGLPETLHLEFQGAAGQSFGAFNIRGLKLSLVGEANDYVGK